jgi:nitrogen regulatory protein PII
MSQFKLFVSIVPHDKGELVTGAAVAAGSGGGTVLMGRGVAASAVLAAFGLGDMSKDIVFIISEESKKQTILGAIVHASEKERQHFGILFSIDVDCMIKTGNVSGGEADMSAQKAHEMISVILNKGYADDAMAAARKAGAGGGTIINARGTAKETDAKFFGMHIVPEKEMLMIVVESDKLNNVLEAIRALPCLSEPGSGIAFCSPVDDFTMLGKKSS